jgi:hypothetical protein
MRHLGVLLLAACPAAIFAQTPETDQRVLQTLLTEVQQLRMAIERQTLLGTRTQIAISQLQLQESRAAAAAKELSTVREEAAHAKEQKTNWTAGLKDLEQKRNLGAPTPQVQEATEGQIKDLKMMLEMSAGRAERISVREGELTAQFQAAQRDLQDSRNRIAEMEKALDAAIQQMLKGK